MSTQSGWKWCAACQGLFYGPYQPSSTCPAGGRHTAATSGDYTIDVDAGPSNDRQSGWRWCSRCRGMFYGPDEATSTCPGDPLRGPHTSIDSGDYSLFVNAPNAGGQQQWAWCRKCKGLFYGPNVAQSVCPSGTTPGPHDATGSGSYTLPYVPHVDPPGDAWTQDSLIPSDGNAYGTSGPPAVVTFDNTVYCIREGRDGQGWMWRVTNDGTGWTQDALLPCSENAYGTANRPGLCVHETDMYVMHQGRGGDSSLWMAKMNRSVDGIRWGADIRLPDSAVNTQTSSGVRDWPSLAVVPNFLNGETRLVCVFRPAEITDPSNNSFILYTSHALSGPFDSGWTEPVQLPASWGPYEWTPSCAVFGTLFIVLVPSLGFIREVVFDTTTGQWRPGWGLVQVGNTAATANSGPGLAVHNGVLYAIYENAPNTHDSGELWVAKRGDSTGWTSIAKMQGQSSTYGTSGPAALAVTTSNGLETLHCLHQGQGDDGWTRYASTTT